MLAWRSAFGTVARSIKLYCNVDDKKTIDFFFPSTLRKKKNPKRASLLKSVPTRFHLERFSQLFFRSFRFSLGWNLGARARACILKREQVLKGVRRERKKKKKKLNDAFRYIRRVHVSFLERTKGQNTLYAPPPPPSLPHCSCPFVLRRWTDR